MNAEQARRKSDKMNVIKCKIYDQINEAVNNGRYEVVISRKHDSELFNALECYSSGVRAKLISDGYKVIDTVTAPSLKLTEYTIEW